MPTQKISTLKTVNWLIGSTKDLLPPLMLACILACATRIASLGIYLVAGMGLIKVLQVGQIELLAGLGWGVLVALIIFLGLLKGVVRYLEQYIGQDRKSTRLNSSHVKISYAVFCLKKK